MVRYVHRDHTTYSNHDRVQVGGCAVSFGLVAIWCSRSSLTDLNNYMTKKTD